MIEQRRATSWTGSEGQRREQLPCAPPTKPPNRTPRFLVRAGTKVMIRRVTDRDWRPYITVKDAGFERHERYRDEIYEFRSFHYLMRVHRNLVGHREERY